MISVLHSTALSTVKRATAACMFLPRYYLLNVTHALAGSSPAGSQLRLKHTKAPPARGTAKAWKYWNPDALPPSAPTLEPFHKTLQSAILRVDIEKAEQTYTHLNASNIAPDGRTLELMLRAHMTGAFSRVTGRRRALTWHSIRRMEELIRESRTRGIIPSRLAYNLLLQGYGSVYPADRYSAWLIYQQMLSDKVIPDKRTFGNLIAVYMRRSDVQGAERVVEEMRRLKWQPNCVIYAALMHTYVKNKRIADALALFHRMRSESVHPNAYIYTEIIHAHVSSNDMLEAERTYQAMLAAKVQPSEVTICEMMRGYLRSNDVNNTQRHFDEFAQQGLVPPTMAYNMLLQLYGVCGDSEKFAEAIAAMERTGAHKDIVTYNTLIRWATAAGNTDEAFRYHQQLQQAGLHPDSITKSSLPVMPPKNKVHLE